MKVKLTNDFHSTETVVLTADGTLTTSQVARSARKLCGIDGCTCGDVAGARPVQVEQLNPEGTMFAVIE